MIIFLSLSLLSFSHLLFLALSASLQRAGAHILSHIPLSILARARTPPPTCHIGAFKSLRAKTRLTERKSSTTENMTAACNILVTILFPTPAHSDLHTHHRATHAHKLERKEGRQRVRSGWRRTRKGRYHGTSFGKKEERGWGGGGKCRREEEMTTRMTYYEAYWILRRRLSRLVATTISRQIDASGPVSPACMRSLTVCAGNVAITC